MNSQELEKDMRRDEITRAVASKRTRQWCTRAVVPLILVLSVAVWFRAGDRSSSESSVADVGLVAPPESMLPVESDFGGMEIIESDEELLDLLTEFGPVLAEQKDGTQVLMLTANRPGSSAR